MTPEQQNAEHAESIASSPVESSNSDDRLSAKVEAASTASAPKSAFRLSKPQKENLQIVAIALVLALVIRLLIAEPRFIPSDSMVPTLQIGDRLVVEKVSYHFRAPARGNIIVFDPPQQLQRYGYAPDKAFIKRIIGTPGDLVQIKAGQVYLNNQPIIEPYIAEPPAYQLAPVRVPQNQYFVMGDNRNNSNDSHVWGFLPRQNIIGRAVFRFFPIDRLGQPD